MPILHGAQETLNSRTYPFVNLFSFSLEILLKIEVRFGQPRSDDEVEPGIRHRVQAAARAHPGFSDDYQIDDAVAFLEGVDQNSSYAMTGGAHQFFLEHTSAMCF